MGVSSVATWVGVLALVSLGSVAAVIASGRLGVRPVYAVVPSVLALVALLGTLAGVSARTERERRTEQARVEAIVAREHRDVVRAAAPETIQRATALLDQAEAMLREQRIDEAYALADQARGVIAETAALTTPAEGAPAVAARAEQLRSDYANLRSISAAMADAQEASESEPGEDIVAWDAHLETLADALRAAPPVAAEYFGRELTARLTALERRRERYRRQLERELRARERAERDAQVAVRELYATTLDRAFIQDGIEVDDVQAAGQDGTVLRIRYALCGRVFLDRVAGGASAQQSLRSIGFTRVECRSYFQRAAIDL